MTSDQVFHQHLGARLTQKPNQHIIKHELAKLSGIPVYHGYSFGLQFETVIQPFSETDGTIIRKIFLTADVSLYDDTGRHFNDDFKGCRFEFYLVEENGVYDSAYWLLLDLDDLLFYLNRNQNEKAVEQFQFPKLDTCVPGTTGYDFIMEGRVFRNKYFEFYDGPVFDTYYGDELNELFAIATNGLAFLYRMRDRATEEMELTHNYHYESTLHLHPRFNNAIAEVAGTIYAAWERVAFLFHEFFPLYPNARMAPSFKRYISDKLKEAAKDSRLQNADLDWFDQRIQNDYAKLEELRHPTVHYNKSRTPSGTRAVELMKGTTNQQTVMETIKNWHLELEFLKAELKAFDDGLPHAIGLLNSWASALC